MKNQKKGGIFAGVITGFLMVIIGTVLLWWNEGNSVRNIRTTNEVEKNVVEIVSLSDSADYQGQLVALGGRFVIHDDPLTDGTFGVSKKTAALVRTVEIYQWEEDSDTDDDGHTTYSYDKVWHEGLINSSNFHRSGHDNPTSAPYESQRWQAEKITLGNYRLSDTQISKISARQNLEVSSSDMTVPKKWHVTGGYLTNANDIGKPEIGDVRVSWSCNGWKELSLIATVSGDSFVGYTSKQGKTVNYVTDGNKSAAEMIAEIRAADKVLKWALRLLGVILVFAGYMSVISPLTKLASFVPLLGNVINGALGLAVFLIAMVHSLLIIAVAWIRFRPLLGIVLLAVCAGCAFLAHMLMNKRRAAVKAA